MDEKANKINELQNINVDLVSKMNRLKIILGQELNTSKKRNEKYDIIKQNCADIKN